MLAILRNRTIASGHAEAGTADQEEVECGLYEEDPTV